MRPKNLFVFFYSSSVSIIEFIFQPRQTVKGNQPVFPQGLKPASF